MRLKDAIYSPECRAFVERVAGLDTGTLTDEVSRIIWTHSPTDPLSPALPPPSFFPSPGASSSLSRKKE